MSAHLGILKWLLSALIAALLLTGCLGSDTSGTASTSISGTAATGAAMTGTIDLVDANGITRTVTIGANGAFSIDTTGLAAPMILKANGNGGAVILFSLADALSGVFNISPLTNLALEVLRQGDAGGPADLNAVFDGWNGLVDPADLAEIQGDLRDALARVNANLQAQFEANGLDEMTFDFLRTAFTPNGNGIDRVLDDIRVVFGEGGVVINNPAGARLGDFNFQISIAGFNIGVGGGGAGGGGGGAANCDGGATATTYSGAAAAPYANGSSVCFTATPTSLAFSGKTLTNPVAGPVGQYTIVTFSDADTGYKYETVLVTATGALHEINLLNNSADPQQAFLGQFAPAAAGGGGGAGGAGGAGTLTITTSGSLSGVNYAIPAITVSPVTAPADFCSGVTGDSNYQQILNSVNGGNVVVLTFNGCTYSGNVGTINMTITLNSIVQLSGPYTITYTYN